MKFEKLLLNAAMEVQLVYKCIFLMIFEMAKITLFHFEEDINFERILILCLLFALMEEIDLKSGMFAYDYDQDPIAHYNYHQNNINFFYHL